MARGRFITFEGGEGAGKTSQIERLAGSLRQSGRDVLTTREPGGSPGGEEIRGLLVTGAADRWDPWCELLLHVAARRIHLVRRVLPALEAGQWVLSDRFADSTMAYQGYGQGLGRDAVQSLSDLVLGDLQGAAPDLTLVLDVPVQLGLQRAAKRPHAENRYESMGTAFHQRLRGAFREIAALEPERCVLIDAGGDIESVAAAVWSTVRARLGIDGP